MNMFSINAPTPPQSEHKKCKAHEIAIDLCAPTCLYVRGPQIITYEHKNCKTHKIANGLCAPTRLHAGRPQIIARTNTRAAKFPRPRTTCARRHFCTLEDHKFITYEPNTCKAHEIANDLCAPTLLYARRPQIITYEPKNCKAHEIANDLCAPTRLYARRPQIITRSCFGTFESQNLTAE